MKKYVNINKSMSKKESQAYMQDLIAKGDLKLKPIKKPMSKKELQALVRGQLDLIKNNPKFREALLGKSALQTQKKMNAKYGKDK